MADARPYPQWAPHEQPSMPGSVPTPDKPAWLRVVYGFVGVLIGLTGGFGNALITVNLANLQGSLGLSPVEAAWLPTVFVMSSVCASMLLFKVRQQYGLRLFTEISLGVYVLLMVADLFTSSLHTELMVRAAAGFTNSCLSSLSIFYLLQVPPPAHKLKALVFGISIPTISIPLVRLFSSYLLQIAEWRGVHLFELGMAVTSFGAVVLLKLPPTQKFKAFEKADFLTFALFVPGVALLCAVLGLGRTLWWTEAPWLGWALAGAVVLLTTSLVIEHNRANPLLHTRWMASADIIRFGLTAMLVRVILSEQTFGAVGLLQTLGVGPDQLHGLFRVILLATLAGAVASAVVLDPARLGPPILASLALMAAGAFLDARATNLTRPENMYLSQALMAFGAALFVGPAMLFGVVRALQQGPHLMISFLAVFGISQTLGGLAGTALLGTLETVRAKFHSNQLVESVIGADPLVAGRMQVLTGAYASTQTDPALRSAQGGALLSQQATREANVLAYNDVFLVIGLIASATFLWILVVYIRARLRTREQALAEQLAHPGSGNL